MHALSQGASRRIPSALNGGRERISHPNPSPFLNYCASSLNRGRERAFVLFLRLFPICHLSSFFLLTKSICVPRRFLGEKWESKGEEKLIDPFTNSKRNASWRSSCVSESVLVAFAKKGVLSPKEVAH